VQSFDLHVWPHSFVFTNSTSGPHVSTQSKSSHINLNLFSSVRSNLLEAVSLFLYCLWLTKHFPFSYFKTSPEVIRLALSYKATWSV